MAINAVFTRPVERSELGNFVNEMSHSGRKIFFSRSIPVLVSLFLACSCEPEDVTREDIPAFLSQYDPGMKAKRDEMVRSLTATREQLSKLRTLQNSYSSQRAKSFVGKQIERVEVQENKLTDILGKFDASIEVAMAAKEMNAADAGGLHSQESMQIISQADKIVKQSNELSSDVTSLFNHQGSADASEFADSEDPGYENQGQPSARMAVIDDDDGWSNLRAAPSTNAKIIKKINQDEPLMVGRAQGKWHEVTTDSGESGWMHSSVIRYTDQSVGTIDANQHQTFGYDGADDGADSSNQRDAGPGWLGIGMVDHYASIMITGVVPFSAADEAGLLVGDTIEIIYFKDGDEWGEPVGGNVGFMELKKEISQRKQGDKIKLEISRNGWSQNLKYVIKLEAVNSPLQFDQSPKARAKKLASVMGRSSVHVALRSFPLYENAEDHDIGPRTVKNINPGDCMVSPWNEEASPVKNPFGRILYTALQVYLASGETGYVRIFENEPPMLETIK